MSTSASGTVPTHGGNASGILPTHGGKSSTGGTNPLSAAISGVGSYLVAQSSSGLVMLLVLVAVVFFVMGVASAVSMVTKSKPRAPARDVTGGRLFGGSSTPHHISGLRRMAGGAVVPDFVNV
jgi:hypothetical protein